MLIEENIFLQQAELMRKGASLIEDRMRQIEIIRQNSNLSIPEQQKKSVVAVFKVRSLKVFRDTLFFLADEIAKTEIREHYYYYHFLIPHARTLSDIYANFLHLLINCEDEAKRALTCIGHQLFACRNIQGGDQIYHDILSSCGLFLREINFVFPKNLADLTRVWLKNRQLIFLDKYSVLTEKNIKEYASDVMEVFSKKNEYKIYSYFSESLHGNPYFYTGKPNNERFWVTSTSIATSAFFIELIDKAFLRKMLPRDFRDWLNAIKKNEKGFLELWAEKRKNKTIAQKDS